METLAFASPACGDAPALHILELLFGHAEIMTEFMYESLANLMTNFCLIEADRLNVFLIQHDVGGTG